MRVPWTVRKSNQSILKEIMGILIWKEFIGFIGFIVILNADAEAEAPIFGHLMRRTDSLEKNPMLGKIEGRRSG